MLIEYTDIKTILFEALKEICKAKPGEHYNERYLHHFFTKKLPCGIGVCFTKDFHVHPEWATAVTGTSRSAFYKRLKDGTYCAKSESEGSSGYVDFAIGNLEIPKFGIEFKMSEKFDSKGVSFDYLKLLDSRNPFEVVVSMVIYYGHRKPSLKLQREEDYDLFPKVEQSFEDGSIACDREYHFFIAEILDGRCRLLERNNKSGKFEDITKQFKEG